MSEAYDQLRRRAAMTAYKQIRHLLYPETVHLLGEREMIEALTVANDILAPAERAAADRLPVVLRELELAEQQWHHAAQQRDIALRFADALAYAVGELVDRGLEQHEPGPKLWRAGLSIVDEIAVANSRPRPSEVHKRKAAAA